MSHDHHRHHHSHHEPPKAKTVTVTKVESKPKSSKVETTNVTQTTTIEPESGPSVVEETGPSVVEETGPSVVEEIHTESTTNAKPDTIAPLKVFHSSEKDQVIVPASSSKSPKDKSGSKSSCSSGESSHELYGKYEPLRDDLIVTSPQPDGFDDDEYSPPSSTVNSSLVEKSPSSVVSNDSKKPSPAIKTVREVRKEAVKDNKGRIIEWNDIKEISIGPFTSTDGSSSSVRSTPSSKTSISGKKKRQPRKSKPRSRRSAKSRSKRMKARPRKIKRSKSNRKIRRSRNRNRNRRGKK